MAIPIVLSAPRPAPAFTPMFVAMDRGFLAAEGLDATIKYQLGVQGLLSGEADVLGNDLGHVEFLKGANIRRICGHSTSGGEHVLVIRPEVGSIDRLKEVLVSGQQNVIELGSILAHYGIDLEKSGIKTTFIEGSHPRQFEALKQGMGDGATLGTPWWIYAVKEGYLNMGSGAEYGPALPTSGMSVTYEKIIKKPQLVRAFVRGYVRAMKHCRENVPETLDTMVKYSKEWGVDSLETAKMVYDIKAPYWSPKVNVAGVERLLQLTAAKIGKESVPASEFLELRFLEEALRDLN